jgi:quercetin dioxygenase-like cupin family protein
MAMEVINVKESANSTAVRGAKIKGGCVCLAPGKNIGTHTTGGGEEILLVLDGEATVTANGEAKTLKKDECVLLPQETAHDVANHADSPLTYVYFVGISQGIDSKGSK